MADENARGELLASMPTCRRGEDGALDVTEAAPRPPAETTPFAPHFTFAASAGAAFSSMMSNQAQPSGFGPYVELEASYRFRRHLSVGLTAGYSAFHDPMVVEPIQGQTIDVAEASYEALARVNLHYAKLVLGVGVGVDYETYPNTLSAAALACAELHAAYEVARIGPVAAHVLAVLGGTRGSDEGSPTGGDLVSGRIGVRLSF